MTIAGLPRLRLPSRNWMIFLSVTGSIAGGIVYDKYQTRRVREKWCNLVSHIPDEPLSTHTMPRKMTVYLAAPPGDGLRSAREHFHNYVKPVLVAAAMDWDVVEGRKEGDVRYKTAQRIRRKRKRAGEGQPLPEDEAQSIEMLEAIRRNTGTTDYDGIAGDLVIGRNTWKEYIRGLHEGWLGPVDPPKQPEAEPPNASRSVEQKDGQSSLGDVAVKAAVRSVAGTSSTSTGSSPESANEDSQDASPTAGAPILEDASKDKEEEEEKPKPRQPPPYIQPQDYPSANPSSHIPEVLGPSQAVRLPHILGFRNTPIRIYRFFTRRYLADAIGRDVAAAVLEHHRLYSTGPASGRLDQDGGAGSELELSRALVHEEKDWWKTTYLPRKDHEESVWIEDVVLDERITSRMRAFRLTAEDEDRANTLADGSEKVTKHKGLDDE